MRATCIKPASPLAQNAFSPNQSGKLGSRETNRWLARRMLAELILEREKGRKSAARQAAEKIRRQKRRRSRRQKQKMLDDKHAHSEVKRLRRTIPSDD